MAKKNRGHGVAQVQGELRSKADLEEILADDIDLIVELCDSFDAGHERRGRQISAVLRRLLEDGESGVLHQLGRLDQKFADTAGPMSVAVEGAIADPPICTLTAVRLKPGAAFYAPKGLDVFSLCPFNDWWNMIVFDDKQGVRLTRRDLVRLVSDKDGGVHVDRRLPVGYWRISRMNSLQQQALIDGGGEVVGYAIRVPSPKPGSAGEIRIGILPNRDVGGSDLRHAPLEGRPEMMCMRQIALEVLLTLDATRAKSPSLASS